MGNKLEEMLRNYPLTAYRLGKTKVNPNKNKTQANDRTQKAREQRASASGSCNHKPTQERTNKTQQVKELVLLRLHPDCHQLTDEHERHLLQQASALYRRQNTREQQHSEEN
jgi:hypothetical protein